MLNATRSGFFFEHCRLVRLNTRDKWLKASHDAGSALIQDVIVHMYRFDCYATSHCKYGSLASITNLRILVSSR